MNELYLWPRARSEVMAELSVGTRCNPPHSPSASSALGRAGRTLDRCFAVITPRTQGLHVSEARLPQFEWRPASFSRVVSSLPSLRTTRPSLGR